MTAVSANPSASLANAAPPRAAEEPRRTEPLVLLLSARFEARGTCNYTLRLAENLPRHGIRAAVACTSAAAVAPSRREGLSIAEHPYLESPLLSRWAVSEWCKRWRKHPPDLVHVQSRKILPAAQKLCRRLRVPYVVTIHDLQQSRRRFPSTVWGRRLIAVSDAVKENLATCGQVAESSIQVIRSGVDVPDLSAAPTREPGRVPVVGTAGPLERIKGHPYFLQAAQIVLGRGIDAEFLIAGAGPEESNLRRLTRLLGIAEKVTFVPYLHEFSEVLRTMDVFCLPSLQQGLGTVMLDAMARSKPVIASGVGGVYSVVHDGQTGLLVPRGDASALADKIVALLENAEEARRLGRNARELVASQFAVEPMVEQTAQLYREVLQSAAVTRDCLPSTPGL
jgi:glycosyltransferase involved in cell wall biosynthesis